MRIDKCAPAVLSEADRADPDMVLATMLGQQWEAQLHDSGGPVSTLRFNGGEELATTSPSADAALQRSYTYVAALVALLLSGAALATWRRTKRAADEVER